MSEAQLARVRGSQKRVKLVHQIMAEQGITYTEASQLLKERQGKSATPKAKSRISAAGRKKISAALKKRHAAAKVAKATPAAGTRIAPGKLVLFVSGGVFKLCALVDNDGEIQVKNVKCDVIVL